MTPFQHETAPKDKGSPHLDLKENEDLMAAHQQTERRFSLGVLRTVFVVMALLGTSFLYPDETADILASVHRYLTESSLFERDLALRNKDNGNGNENSQIGVECGPNKKCGDKSVCDGGLCRTCGKESEICCGFESFYGDSKSFDSKIYAHQRAPTIGDCEGNLECDFNTELFRQNCRKCWETKLDRCGFDSTCCDKTTTCQDDECVPCGGKGQVCCDDARAPARCNDDLECGEPDGGGFPDVCKSGCTTENGSCDTENPCCGQDDNKLYCDGGTCVKCGGNGQPSCDENSYDCDDGFWQSKTGNCEPCGAKDQSCCFSDRTRFGLSDLCNDPTLACDDYDSKNCVTCAALEQDCSDGTPCCSPFECNPSTGKCSECGGVNQPCCFSDDIDCDGRLACDEDVGLCRPCGGFTEIDCDARFDGYRCDSGLSPNSNVGSQTSCDKCAGELESCAVIPCCEGERLRCGDDDVCLPCGGKDERACQDAAIFACNPGLFEDCDSKLCTDDVFDACYD